MHEAQSKVSGRVDVPRLQDAFLDHSVLHLSAQTQTLPASNYINHSLRLHIQQLKRRANILLR